MDPVLRRVVRLNDVLDVVILDHHKVLAGITKLNPLTNVGKVTHFNSRCFFLLILV